jgi:hypothetical protein
MLAGLSFESRSKVITIMRVTSVSLGPLGSRLVDSSFPSPVRLSIRTLLLPSKVRLARALVFVVSPMEKLISNVFWRGHKGRISVILLISCKLESTNWPQKRSLFMQNAAPPLVKTPLYFSPGGA